MTKTFATADYEEVQKYAALVADLPSTFPLELGNLARAYLRLLAERDSVQRETWYARPSAGAGAQQDISDTPKTDAAAFKQEGRYAKADGTLLDPIRELVDAEIARQLERELAAACAACATLAGLCEVKAIDPQQTEPHKQHIEQGFRILEAVRAAARTKP